ncbi:hypothetical protein JR316_0009411 [Psilocybe cubensis]|uniref:Uncharacterized protein n=2 Tax=Psilocybe cubensis TaxID=181762 RepID=A0A8H7XVA4_PSICU|nr:hypothetical protein JR316_0009411 [Psilocybe cubensis]KAH9478948.1 hypothetical protein JR316_0009411 [Psilocybe cubensis]
MSQAHNHHTTHGHNEIEHLHHQQHHRDEDGHHHHYSVPARKLVFTKGILDILVSLFLLFFPSFFLDGPLTSAVYNLTGIPAASWGQDHAGVASLSALVMGCGFAGITAGQTASDDGYRVVAALNGAFAIAGFIICLLSPHKYGSVFLLFMSIQDIIWYAAIVHAGSFGPLDSLGLSSRGLCVLEERLSRDVLRRKAEFDARHGHGHHEKHGLEG